MTSQAVYRRRRIVVFGGVSSFLVSLVFLFATASAPLPVAAMESSFPEDFTQAPSTLVLPAVGTHSLYADGFGVLAQTGSDAQQPIASITKVITALVVLQAKPLSGSGDEGPMIQFTQDDVEYLAQTKAELGSFEELPTSMQMTQRQALTVMMLTSANNYAQTLARWAYGSPEAYLDAANAWLTTQGLTETFVADTSGIDSGSVSTPSNLLSLGSLVLANEALAEIVSTKKADIPGLGEISNSNKLLGEYGVTGIKTGTTVAAGSCLLYSATFDVGKASVTVIGVTLGMQTQVELRDVVTTALQQTQSSFHEVVVTAQNDLVGTASTLWGATTPLVAAESFSTIVFGNTPITTRFVPGDLRDGPAGISAGSLEILVGETLSTVGVVTQSEIPAPGLDWRLSHLSDLY
jgi:D-alanyl-D-alanine carboxypeptidase (penicillin-binding protein 5/6)